MEWGKMHYQDIAKRLSTICDCICHNKDEIVSILTKHETYKTAISEVKKCISCLENVDKQAEYLSKPTLMSLCSFLPLNQPLYSLVLFVVIPGCRFHEVYFRPPVLLSDTYRELFFLLNLSKWNIFCEIVSRRVFITERARKADCVIYTGKYKNAMEVREQIPLKTVFIFQGSAANPIIIADNADISDTLVEKVVMAQIYNSGQDCMAPSAVFVHRTHRATFLKKLKKRVNALVVGEYEDANTDISRLIEYETLENAEKLISSSTSKLLLGGEIDKERQIVYPSIIEFFHICDIPAESSFAPVFSVYSFEQEQEVLDYLSREDCQANKSYATMFGNFMYWNRDEIVIQDDILDSVDDGNSEFGGYGRHSGFISYDGLILSKPILISKELALFSRQNGMLVPEGDMDFPIFESYIALSLINFSHKRILEIGCGMLPHAQYLAPRCEEYFAIDSNNNKIETIIGRCGFNKEHVYNLNAVKTNFLDNSFSSVLMFHCLHEVELVEQGKILSEVRRILEDEGLLLIVDAIPDRTTRFQECFDIVHEGIADYKHVLGVQHADWIVNEYIKRGFFLEIYNHRFLMNYHYPDFESFVAAIIESFQFELSWDEGKKSYLKQSLLKHFGEKDEYDLEEEVSVKLLKKCRSLDGDVK